MAKVRVPGKVEWFDGVIGTNGITTMTPGALAPSIAVQRRGARNASMGADGRSGRVKIADTEYYWPNLGDGIFQIEGWFNFKQFGQTVGAQESWTLGAHRAAGQIIYVYHKITGELGWFDGIGGGVLTGSFLTRAAWVYLSLLVNQSVAAGISGAGLYRMDRGGSVLTIIKDRTATAMGGQVVDRWQFLNSSVFWAGMISGLSIYQLGSMADATIYPPDVIQPTAAPITINLRNSGSATNDGSEAAPILADVTRLIDEVKYGTLDGDTVSIGAPGSPIDNGSKEGAFNLLDTRDLTIRFEAAPLLHRNISGLAAGGPIVWTQPDVGGAPNVWTYHDTATDNASTAGVIQGAIVYRNGVEFAAHPVGATFAANKAALNTTDAQWVDYAGDGTADIYIHSTTNPNTDATLSLVRSRVRSDGINIRNAYSLTRAAGTTTISGLYGDYVGTVSKTDNNIIGGGIIAIEGANAGVINIINGGGNHWGEQLFGRGTTGAGLVVNYTGIQVGRGHPYCTLGTCIAFVDEPTDATTDQEAHYTDIVSTDANNAFLTSHSDAGKMAVVSLVRAVTANQLIDTQGLVTSMPIKGSVIGKISNQKAGGVAPVGTVTISEGSRINGLLAGAGFTLLSGVVWAPVATVQAGNANQSMFGVNSWIGVTITDAGLTAGDAAAAYVNRTGAGTFTFGGCIIAGTKDIAMTAGAATGEVVSDDNVIERAASARWQETYNGADKTGTQFIALGQDTHSQFSANAGASAVDFKIPSGSPARGAVSLARWPQLASQPDYRGRIRPASGTTDAGAVQYFSLASSFQRTRPGRNPRFSRV